MSIKVWLIVLIWLTLIVLSVFTYPNTTSGEKTQPDVILATSTPSETIATPLKAELRENLKFVCGCESAGSPHATPRQFEVDGVTVRYGRVNNLDKGMCQINLHYHEETANKLGFDVFTEYGNIMYANWLYDHQGLSPWSASKPCWGNSVK